MKIDIVIVNWNSGNLLFECIESITNYRESYVSEVYVIDNASDDEHFYNLTLRWPNDHRGLPTIFTNPVSDYAFSEKNMENEMLHKVRRTNNIITQRSGGGAVVARGT